MKNSNINKFKLETKMKPSGDQPKAIEELVNNINNGIKSQVLLGATGTGKTFTIANVIEKTNKKTLILVHNKTLAAQLYMEVKEMFPNNKVEYFVSYFDYYQPEAYIPKSDMYIEKTSMTNKEIEMLRLSTLNSLADRNDVIVIASVAAIYASVSKQDFNDSRMLITKNQIINIKDLRLSLIKLNYKRNDTELSPGTFRSKGDVLDISVGYDDNYFIRISFFGDEIESITTIDSINQTKIKELEEFSITSANEYIVGQERFKKALEDIQEELEERVIYFNKQNKLLEGHRISERTRQDLESLREFGFCAGIENYSKHLEQRPTGSTPFTIFDFFNNPDDWLLVVDESHMTLPQVRGMYNTDRSRKETLVNYGFRLPSALDNRPLNYDEFLSKIKFSIFISATPNDWEIDYSDNYVTRQIVRPTGLLDPKIEIRPKEDQFENLIKELNIQRKTNEKTFITVLTIKSAELLSEKLKERGFEVPYLHNELKTLERAKLLNDLRKDKYEGIIGINLLREGLDIPEVSLVSIFDADKPGFFRNDKSLIQIIGRAARNINGRVIMYADEITDSMDSAIKETNNRRKVQEEHNKKHNIVPKTIIKSIKEDVKGYDENGLLNKFKTKDEKEERNKLLESFKKQMLAAADERDYEKAAEIRDIIIKINEE